jgi:hypothetical protein
MKFSRSAFIRSFLARMCCRRLATAAQRAGDILARIGLRVGAGVRQFLVLFDHVSLPVFFKRDYFMKNEQHDHGNDGLAEIWRNANHRRMHDLRWLIARIFKTVAVQLKRTRSENALGKTLLASGDSSFAPGKARMTGG